MSPQTGKKTDQTTTDFGYQQVSLAEKTRRVGAVFSSVAGRYDLMNDLMSFGLHRLWKRFAIELAAVRPGQRILDLAGGTGDLTARLADKAGERGEVMLTDINRDMLARGRERLLDQGLAGNLSYVQADAERLPFVDDTFDCILMAFGLRNITDKAAALGSMQRVLRPGGRALVLEFSRPHAWLRPAYDAYSFNVLPRLGAVVAHDAGSYRYLAESIRMHPDQETLMDMMQTAGFERCDYWNLSAGIVALHRGFKI